MNRSVRIIRFAVIAAAGFGLCLTAGAAQAQRGGRGSGPAGPARSAQSANNGSQTGQNGSTMPGQNGGCMQGNGSTTTTSGTTTSSSGAVALTGSTSAGTVSAQRASTNRVVLQWSGNTGSVQAVYLGVLDANMKVIDQTAVTELPVRATLATSAAARYYGVQIVYANGTTHTSYTPIR
jgi:hypothetical protein